MYGNGNQLTVYCVSVFPSLITSGVDIFLNCVIIGLFIAANCSQIKFTEVGCEKGRIDAVLWDGLWVLYNDIQP